MGEKRRKQPSPLAKEFGKQLRRIREDRFLSQRQLAEGIGIEIAQVSRYERGVFFPNVETLIHLAEFLRVSVGLLLFAREEGTPSNQESPIQDITLLERFRRLEKLSRKDREMVVGLIDALISSREHEGISARMRKTA
jgi:transcriptional regulator with XRE-family HTH domain